jgi:hypothetical protein
MAQVTRRCFPGYGRLLTWIETGTGCLDVGDSALAKLLTEAIRAVMRAPVLPSFPQGWRRRSGAACERSMFGGGGHIGNARPRIGSSDGSAQGRMRGRCQKARHPVRSRPLTPTYAHLDRSASGAAACSWGVQRGSQPFYRLVCALSPLVSCDITSGRGRGLHLRLCYRPSDALCRCGSFSCLTKACWAARDTKRYCEPPPTLVTRATPRHPFVLRCAG